MKFKEYLSEKFSRKYKTKKDKTGHTHDLIVDFDGNGKTTSTKGGGDPKHVHRIHEWTVQPAKEHIHSVDI